MSRIIEYKKKLTQDGGQDLKRDQLVVLEHLDKREDQSREVVRLPKDVRPEGQGRERPLEHPQQLTALHGALLVEGGERGVCPLLQEGAVGAVVLWKLEETTPDEHSILGRVFPVAFQDRLQLVLAELHATPTTHLPVGGPAPCPAPSLLRRWDEGGGGGLLDGSGVTACDGDQRRREGAGDLR